MFTGKTFLSIAGAVALLVVLVIGGWWFFIREDANLATDPRDIPEELSQQTDGAPAAEAGTFRIIPEESEAAYFVGEELARLPLPSTATGTTNAIQGEFILTTDSTSLAAGTEPQFTVDLTTLRSDESRRDRRVQEALETNLFPFVSFTVSNATGYDPAIPEGEDQALSLTGLLDLHGVEREVTWEVKVRREGAFITALATVTFDFADFAITPPNVAGFVSVGDEVTLQMQIIAEAV